MVMEDEKFTFRFETKLPMSSKKAFDWHKRPGMLLRLSPPFLKTRLMNPQTRLELSDVAHIKMMLFGDVGLDAFFEIVDIDEGKAFTDKQIKGPFTLWEHRHIFEDVSENECLLIDRITFQIPLESFLGALINNKIAKRLDHLFKYRRQILLNDIDFCRRYSTQKLHILMTGTSGLIGQSLSNFLETMGHHVMPITRNLQADQKGIFWDIENQKVNIQDFEDYDALIHLAGENVGGIWTETKKEKIYKSRIHSTRLLVNTLKQLKKPPKTFICASGANFYIEGEKSCEDQKSAQQGFLNRVIHDWEQEALNYQQGRVVLMRTGAVLSPKGGMLKKLLSSFELGLGAKIGNGKNHLSWISIDDAVYQYAHALFTPSLVGPVNLTAPHVVTNEHFSKTLAKTLKRPFFLKLPKGLLSSIFGEMAQETILSDLIVEPKKLLESKSKFYYADLDYALKHLLGAYDS